MSFVVGLVLACLMAQPPLVQAQREMLERDQARFYTLMPMFMPDGPNSLDYEELLWAMTRDQGYEAHCGQMEWQLDKDLWGAISKFFSQETPPIESFYHTPRLNPTIFGEKDDSERSDPYVVDFSKARIPMFRDLTSPNDLRKNTSFQGMFGANYRQVSEYMLNASGVGQNLLSSYQQCLAKAQNIVASAYICDEIANEECTLDKEQSFYIAMATDGTSRELASADAPLYPGEVKDKVSFYMKELRKWFADIRPDLHGKEMYEQVCFDITGGDSTTANPNYQPPPATDLQLARLRQAIARLPIDLDTLYRLAFLVISPQQNKGKEDDGDKFYWLQDEDSGGQIDSEAHAPIFIAFKIPDLGTNKSRIAGNIDTLELSKMVLQTKEQNDKDLLDQTKKRETIYEAAKASVTIPDGDQVINCPEAYAQCRSPLNKVIKDIVNGLRLRCHNDTLRIIEPSAEDEEGYLDTSGLSLSAGEKQAKMNAVEFIFNQEDLNWERAGDLFTPATKDVKTNEYRSPVNTEVANRLGSSKTNYYEWQLVIDNDPPDLEAPVKVNAYIVLPMGETIKDVNKSLSIFWDEQTFFDMIKNNVIEDMVDEVTNKSKMGAIPKYYTIKDAIFGFTAVDSINPLDERTYELVTNPDGTQYKKPITTRYTFGVGFSETKGEMLIPDFGLGFMIRKIQQAVRATFDKSYNYISSCQRVEDMFLGRCKGNPDGQAAADSFCDGEAFKNIKGAPSAGSVPSFAQEEFEDKILPLLTPAHIAAYKHAEEVTGIPCEVVAGIHWTEAGLNPNGSVFSGAPLQTSLEKDAEEAMKYLSGEMWPGTFDRNNIPFEDLVAAIANFNGPGNLNCSYDLQDSPRATRWRTGGRCEAQYFGEDHPHALAWIDDRHNNMDLIYCMDFIEWSCQTLGTEEEAKASADYIRNWMQNVDPDDRWDEERIQAHVQESLKNCYAKNPLCQAQSGGSKYLKYERPGSLTTAILLNAAGSAASP